MKIDISEEVRKKWGVYKIRNLINGEIYFGSTTENFAKRIAKHMSQYFNYQLGNTKRRDCPKLYDSFEEFGINNFEVTVVKILSNKRDSLTNLKIVRYLEEKLIERYDSQLNVCRKPTLSGCPNLGRKLSQKWKDNIGKKSKLYKHSNNRGVFDKKSQQNKDLSSIYRVENINKSFTGSLIDCSKFLGKDQTSLHNWINGKKSISGWKITKIRSQTKRIKLFIKEEEKIFNSFGECDRFLDMWRGFTSTQVVNKRNTILEYKYELI